MLYTAKYEYVFLSVILKRYNLMKILLEIILKEEVVDYVILSNKLIKDKVNEKGMEVDVLVLVNKKLINIELNTNFSETIKEKNMSYLERIMLSLRKKGGKYKNDEITNVIQANINFNRKGNNELENISIYNETEKSKYLKNPIILNYNIDFYKYLYYNVNNKLTKEQIFFAMLDLPLKDLEILGKEIDFVNEYKNALIEVNDDMFDFTMTEEEKEYYMELSIEEAKREGLEKGIKKGRKEGKKEGKLFGIIEVAKQMLKENLDIDLIQRITKLDRKKIGPQNEVLSFFPEMKQTRICWA